MTAKSSSMPRSKVRSEFVAWRSYMGVEIDDEFVAWKWKQVEMDSHGKVIEDSKDDSKDIKQDVFEDAAEEVVSCKWDGVADDEEKQMAACGELGAVDSKVVSYYSICRVRGFFSAVVTWITRLGAD